MTLGPLFEERPLPSGPTGSELRDRGLELVDSAEPETWRRAADAAIRELALVGVEFNAEDVRAIVGDPLHPNAMGAAFNRAARAGIIRYVKHAPSNRPQLHRCAIRVWVGVKP